MKRTRSRPNVSHLIFLFLIVPFNFLYAQVEDANKISLDGSKQRPFISEVSLFFREGDGSINPIDWSVPITRSNRRIHFMFRLQGDRAYLDSARSRESFGVRILKKSGDRFVRFDSIGMNRIDRKSALVEANLSENNGFFDWRLRGNKFYFYEPGTYKLSIIQGNNLICFDLEGSQDKTCEIEFAVTP